MLVIVIVVVIVFTMRVVVIAITFLRSNVLRHWRPTRALAACVRPGDVSSQRCMILVLSGKGGCRNGVPEESLYPEYSIRGC